MIQFNCKLIFNLNIRLKETLERQLLCQKSHGPASAIISGTIVKRWLSATKKVLQLLQCQLKASVHNKSPSIKSYIKKKYVQLNFFHTHSYKQMKFKKYFKLI